MIMKNRLLWIILLVGFNICHLSAHMSIRVPEVGELRAQLTEEEAQQVTHLTLTGKLNAIDFKVLRDEFNKLEYLDLTNAEIKLYVGKKGTYPEKTYVYPMNCIPAYAFKDKKTLKQVILSPNLKNIEDCAFMGCDNLRICQIKKKKSVNLLPQALNDSLTTVFVPLGSRDEYWRKPQWEHFNILEGDPVSVTVTVNEPGTLDNEIRKSGYRPDQINFLKVSGSMDLADFKNIRDNMPDLVGIDLSESNNGIIPEFTFAQKRYLMYIDFPKTLKTIGQRAFSGCTHLSGELVLPESVTEVGDSAFLGCDRLEKVMLNGKDVK